jgi:hypothetical protein
VLPDNMARAFTVATVSSLSPASSSSCRKSITASNSFTTTASTDSTMKIAYLVAVEDNGTIEC